MEEEQGEAARSQRVDSSFERIIREVNVIGSWQSLPLREAGSGERCFGHLLRLLVWHRSVSAAEKARVRIPGALPGGRPACYLCQQHLITGEEVIRK